jgi:hypothetical protein
MAASHFLAMAAHFLVGSPVWPIDQLAETLLVCTRDPAWHPSEK